MPQSTLESLSWERPILYVLDQLRLPFDKVMLPITTTSEAYSAIKDMHVRGAPLIGIVAGLGLAAHLLAEFSCQPAEQLEFTVLSAFLKQNIETLRQSRPTAVNLFEVLDRLSAFIDAWDCASPPPAFIEAFVAQSEDLLQRDVAANRALAAHGCAFLERRHSGPSASNYAVLTHCNTGSLATAGYGTALGIIRSLFASSDKFKHVYCTETRPYNQGSRLTAFELHHDHIPYTLVTDSMVAYLIAQQAASDCPIKAIIVGADRVCANGDVANKIGTLQLAILAHHFGIDFIVAAPATTIDHNLATGRHIPIEFRPAREMLTASGQLIDPPPSSSDSPLRATIKLTPDFHVWNPSFDVTPAHLITAIVSDHRVFCRDPGASFFVLK